MVARTCSLGPTYLRKFLAQFTVTLVKGKWYCFQTVGEDSVFYWLPLSPISKQTKSKNEFRLNYNLSQCLIKLKYPVIYFIVFYLLK